MVGNPKAIQTGLRDVSYWGARLVSFRVSAVYLTWANALFLAVFALSEINKLRVINEGQNSDSPRLHQPPRQAI